jgi:tetratricopeptide (TPR) repeat protein
LKRLWSELRRRRVVRVTLAYAVLAWVLIQIGDVLFPAFGAPEWSVRALTIALLAGLPVAIVLSWIFDITPEGIVATDAAGKAGAQSFSHSRPKPIKLEQLGLVRRQLTPLIGREDERKKIREALEAAKSGAGRILLISGEPGVGKTRLAEEAVEAGSTMGLLPLAGHTSEELGLPFIVATEIIEEIARTLPEKTLRNVLGNTASEIARLVPDLRRTFPDIPPPLELPPEQQQRYLFNAIVDLITRLCEVSPVVMLLDDLHWADESSVQLLEHLIRHLDSLPILMVITHRDAEMDMGDPFKRALTKLNQLQFVQRIPLRQLSQDEVTSLLTEASGSAPPRMVAELIYRETEGNAFFVQSVFQDLREEGRLFDQDGHWLKEINIDTLAVPDSVRMVTGRRIERLRQDTQDVLAIAAVLGQRFRARVLEAAVAQADTVLLAIEEAESAQLIIPAMGGAELRYEFVHALARQTLLTRLSVIRQQRIHLQLAQAMQQVDADHLERHAADLALHLIEAGDSADREETVHWLKIAGDNAMAASASDEAVRYFSKGLTMLGADDQEIRADLLHRRGSAQLSLGLKLEFQTDLLEAWSLYKTLKAGRKAAMVILELSYILIWNAKPGEAQTLIAEADDLLGNQDLPDQCRLLSARAVAFGMANELTEAQSSHDAAVAMARELEEPGLLAETLQNQALFQWLIVDGSIEQTAHEAASIRREQGQEWSLGQCLWMEKAGLVFQGRFDEAERIDDELLPLAKRNEDYGSLGILAMMSGLIHQARGDLVSSIREFRWSVDLFEKGGFPWGFISEGHLSVNQLLLGDKAGARKAFEIAGANRLLGISWSGADSCYWLSGKSQLGDDDIPGAYRTLQAGLPAAGEVFSGGGVLLLEGCIEALVVNGENAEAARLYPAIRDFVDREIAVLTFTYGLHERFAGMAAAAGHDWENAEKHYIKALSLAEDLPHRVDQARVRYWYANMLLARGEPEDLPRSRQMLNESRTLSEEMGMAGLLESIKGLLESINSMP